MLVFYAFIYIHDSPYEQAKKRNHPQAEAIHVACWLSLFTLHAIWPIVFLWAVAKPRPLSVELTNGGGGLAGNDPAMQERIGQLEERLRKLESNGAPAQPQTITNTGV
jgi:hypothetical protein